MSEVVRVPVGSSHVPCVEADGEPRVVIKTAVESLGLSYSGAMERLKRRSWATIRVTPIVALDGKNRRVATVSVQTWVMFLATVDEDRVAEHLRPLVVEFQRESMQALTDYWTKGFAINSRATQEQLEAAEARIEELHSELDLYKLSDEGAPVREKKAYNRGVMWGQANPKLRLSSVYGFDEWEQDFS